MTYGVYEARHKIPIRADWILKQIQEEKKVRLNNAVIEGNLDISKLELPTKHVGRTETQKLLLDLIGDLKLIKSSIKITDSLFQGDLNLSNSITSSQKEIRAVYS